MGKLIIDGIEFKFQKIYNTSGETDEVIDSMFSYNSLLTYAEMENIKVINGWGFTNCSNLKTAIFKNVRVIGQRAFYFCSGLTKIEIPNAISLGIMCFMASGFESIVLNDDLTEIERSTFAWCPNLKTVKLPSSLEIIGNEAFHGCQNLSISSLPETLERMGEYAFAYTKISITQLPKKVNTIPKYCFSDCNSLTDLTLGEKGYTIISIGEYAFTSCNNLKKLTIYTTGGQTLVGAPWGAPNDTVVTYLPA